MDKGELRHGNSHPDSSAGVTLDEVVRAADGAVLQAKEFGRDKVVVAVGDHRWPASMLAAGDVAIPAG
jgi:hypothetical protein